MLNTGHEMKIQSFMGAAERFFRWHDTILIWSNVAYLFAIYGLSQTCHGWQRQIGYPLVICTFVSSCIFHTIEVYYHDVVGSTDNRVYKIVDTIDNIFAQSLAFFCAVILVIDHANIVNFVMAAFVITTLIVGNTLPWDQYVDVHSLWHVIGAFGITYSIVFYCQQNPDV